VQHRIELNLDSWKTRIALVARMPLLMHPGLHYTLHIQGTPRLIAELQEALNARDVIYSLQEDSEPSPKG
jgi:hypothetical protein